ncbi:DUF2087 domain-containing protein [Lacibacterium aquatile]|uniref:DUF2087 domain-containing protein n=1 Tax=Lacibacterium aquatile TaxID=1168082 RepID=A0ABW5DXI5_9PROT
MSRSVLPFVARDVSSLARSLHRELGALDGKPGHVQLLNMLARSVGYRNFQHFRAGQAAQERLEAVPLPDAPVDHQQVERASRHFDAAGRLLRWPAKAAHRELGLWVLWSRIPAAEVRNEIQINLLLEEWHVFGDPALLRRALFEAGLLTRTRDGREYRRAELPPPPDARALIRHLGRGT